MISASAVFFSFKIKKKKHNKPPAKQKKTNKK